MPLRRAKKREVTVRFLYKPYGRRTVWWNKVAERPPQTRRKLYVAMALRWLMQIWIFKEFG